MSPLVHQTAPADDHTAKNIQAAQIALDGFKSREDIKFGGQGRGSGSGESWGGCQI